MRSVVAFVLVLAACGGTGPASGQQGLGDSYYPLAIGNTWNYRVTLDDGSTEPKVHRVIGHRDFAGGTRWELESIEGAAREVSVTDFAPTTGVRRFRDELYSVATGAMIEAHDYDPFTLRVPPIGLSGGLDETYSVRDYDAKGNPTATREKVHRWLVVSRNEAVTVPAGTFQTLHVRRLNHDGTKTRDYWLAAGVGKVKETGDFLEELTSWDLH